MKFDLQRTENDAVIVAGGRLTYSHAGLIHKRLLEALAGSGRVDLFLHDVLETDLTFLQLLCSAHRTAAERGTVFTMAGLDAESPVWRLIVKAAAQRGAECPEGCLWAGAFDAESSAVDATPGQRRVP